MEWRKHGIVFRPDTSLGWSQSHAMLPTPLLMLELGVLRVFYTACDEHGISRPSYVDMDPADPTRTISRAAQPLLDVGRPGTFDENGVLATSVVRTADGRLLMYFVGFEIGTRIRYRLLTGLAVSEDGGRTFRRTSTTPILERSDSELYFRAGPFVMQDRDRFRMWYVAGSRWVDIDGKPMPEYRIMYLESSDGVSWGPAGCLVMDISQDDEYGFGRPWVLREPEGYSLYYSVRRKSHRAYRMGYARSSDGIVWDRQDDQLNLDAGPDGFDAAAISYAAPIELDSRIWCFYNGNDFGREGFALASRERE